MIDSRFSQLPASATMPLRAKAGTTSCAGRTVHAAARLIMAHSATPGVHSRRSRQAIASNTSDSAPKMKSAIGSSASAIQLQRRSRNAKATSSSVTPSVRLRDTAPYSNSTNVPVAISSRSSRANGARSSTIAWIASASGTATAASAHHGGTITAAPRNNRYQSGGCPSYRRFSSRCAMSGDCTAICSA